MTINVNSSLTKYKYLGRNITDVSNPLNPSVSKEINPKSISLYEINFSLLLPKAPLIISTKGKKVYLF